jgi:hypothetical protein
MVNAQPEIVNVSDERRMADPSAFVTLLLDVALTEPPCGHCIVLAVVR